MLNRAIKLMLGYDAEDSDLEIVEEFAWKGMAFGKPCAQLNYCPYDEQHSEQPLLSLAVDDDMSRDELLAIKEKIANGEWARSHAAWTEDYIEGRLEQLDDPRFDEEVPASIVEACCTDTGRLCPAYTHARMVVGDGELQKHRFMIAECDCCGELFLTRVCG